MRKSVTAAVVLWATMLLAGSISAQILGTKHDFRYEPWNPSGQLCEVCHTDHSKNPGYQMLWDREITTSAFTPYSQSSTMDAVPGAPSGVSLLCLSCHDGTVALENYGGVTDGTTFVVGSANLGTDLRDDHPISFTYDSALAGLDGELFNPVTQPSKVTAGGTIAMDMLFGLSHDQMECSSCHNVHDDSVQPFLIKDNSGGELCLTCHDK